MRPGTPGFIGARLVEARHARGVSASDLALMVDVSRSAISQYEKSQGTPGPDILHRIAKTLNVRPWYFSREGISFEDHIIYFRSMAAATKGVRTKSKVRLMWVSEIGSYVARFAELPAVNVPSFTLPSDPGAISFQRIEALAGETRKHWGLGEGPIGNVARLLENNGIIIARDNLEAETLDGLSCWSNERPEILVTDQNPAARSKFDLAHELGHLILHRHINPKLLDRPGDFQLIEKQAHRFAGAFLFPQKSFAAHAYGVTLDGYRSLKEKWKVSIALMIRRAADLGFISDEHQRRLWVSYTRRGWRGNEPLDDVLPADQPQLLKRSFELIVGEGAQTREDIFSELPFSEGDIEGLAGLEPRFLREESATVHSFDLKLRSRPLDQPKANDASLADVIPIRRKPTLA